MNQITLSYDAITTQHGKPVTTSLQVAKYFGKNHQHVLRDIEAIWLRKSAQPNSISLSKSGQPKPEINEFCRRNFEKATYQDRGKDYPMYYLTKDGFTLLVMGYTGEKAMLFKIAYINAFNQMTATLRSAEVYFTFKAKQELRKRYPKMELVRHEYKQSHQTVEHIANYFGMSPSTVRRNLKRNLLWGAMTEEQFEAAKKMHREFQAMLKKIRAEKGGAA